MTRFSIADFRLPIGPTRIFACVLALGLLLSPLAVEAQQPGKVYRIGDLGVVAPAPNDTTPQQCPIKGDPNWQAWVEGLRERGYIPGRNLVIECRWTEGRDEPTPALAAELVHLKPDLIIATNTANVRVAMARTSTIPIVMVGVLEPVRTGLVASLARPGGNVTGVTDTAGREIVGKRLELLKEAVPTASRVAVLLDALSPYSGEFLGDAMNEARALNVTVWSYPDSHPEEIERAVTAMINWGAEALLVLQTPFVYTQARRIVGCAVQSRLPAMYPSKDFVEAGGLMAYAANARTMFRHAAIYVDRILKGARPADLPVEQPTKFDLIINLKTAKALGLTIPRALRERADEVIQ